MAPTVRKPLTLGFIGRGATSAKNAAALLTDLIEADSGKARFILPATKEHWTEGIEAVADIALEQEWPLVLVTDDTTADVKQLKGYLSQATEKIKVVNPVAKVVKLAAEGSGKLIMLWDDEDDDCYNALEAAEAEGIEALDLTSGLHKLEFTGDASQPDDETPADDEDQGDDLDEMGEEELQDAAESLGLNVEDYPEWEDVRAAIREERLIQGVDMGEVSGGPTADEVQEWDFATLKAYAQENGIEVPPRSKSFGYRKAITDFLAAADSHAEALEQEMDAVAAEMAAEDDGELELPADDEDPAPQAIIDMTEVTAAIASLEEGQTAILSSLTDVHNSVDKLWTALTEKMVEIRTAIMEMSKPGTIQKAQQAATSKAVAGQAAQAQAKAGETIKKAEAALEKAVPSKTVTRKTTAPAKATAATKKVNRPGPMPKAPAPKENPLASFMHLLGKKLTKAQAKEIQIAAALRGRGRPSEEERALIAQAKEVVPNL